MPECSVPSLSIVRLKALGVPVNQANIDRLALHCSGLQFGYMNSPWGFDPAWKASLECQDPKLVEKKMFAWAMSGSKDMSWMTQAQQPQAAPVVAPVVAQAVAQVVQGDSASGFAWREAQTHLSANLQQLEEGRIGLIEGGTGLGKTRVICKWIVERLANTKSSVLVAVPTALVAQQWIAELAEIDANVPVLPVMGLTHYEKPQDQEFALLEAKHAKLVICTQHMLVQLRSLQRWTLVVDEAHLLFFAIAATAGKFLPISAMGKRFESWCVDSLGLQEGQAQEVHLKGAMRNAVLTRFKVDHSEKGVAALAVVQSESGMGVCVRQSGGVERDLQALWSACECAVLLSATQSMRSFGGVRSIRLMAKRLAVPDGRLQDLGQVRASWRDTGVKVMMPAQDKGDDGKVWLAPHASRKELWYEEFAQVMLSWSKQTQRKKTLVLATSYMDVQGIQAACKALALSGVIASSKDVPIRDLQLAFETSQVWCWVATGAAWTGMDLRMPIQRLAVAKLPLQAPEDGEVLVDPRQVEFDCVSRLRQGVGRLVRSDEWIERELVVLDGRINERSPWWRSVCQPYLQVLGEDYEDHQRFEKTDFKELIAQ